jgi:hypothetical protein
MRQRWCRVCGGWHDLKAWPEECFRAAPVARSDLPVPLIISDTMEPTRSPADGRVYTSKSALRATYKPSGNPQGRSYVEMGNDVPKGPPPAPKADVGGIDTAIEKAVARFERGERI